MYIIKITKEVSIRREGTERKIRKEKLGFLKFLAAFLVIS